MKVFLGLLLGCVSCTLSLGQDAAVHDSIVLQLNQELSDLKKLKISGYLQAQFQLAEAKGIAYPGGNFASGVDKRFSMRRARFSANYETRSMRWVLVTENTERGISLHDIFGVYKIPEANMQLTAGLFPRPFGFEQSYSTRNHEGPERARFSTTLLPAEADLGLMLSHTALGPVRLDVGVFNGTATAADFDSYKDFVMRASVKQNFGKQSLSAGLSYYTGSVAQGTAYRYELKNNLDVPEFILRDTLAHVKGSAVPRQYFGADAQYSFTTSIGKTTLRAEYVGGQQPGLAANSDSPKSSAPPGTDAYLRDFNAVCGYFLHRFGTSPWMLVLKFDWYDPNTAIGGVDIGQSGSRTGAADIKYTTLGLGVNCYLKNVYFMAYYDFITNEEAPFLAGFKQDIRDNVFTIRTQFQF
ncbi:MAG: hypothetical protein IT266_06360 [Saprospiraceae bacterium]|nr:hypothetical protein [Saprospiraceae bacterium]